MLLSNLQQRKHIIMFQHTPKSKNAIMFIIYDSPHIILYHNQVTPKLYGVGMRKHREYNVHFQLLEAAAMSFTVE